jgi:hypothetical protein
METFGDKLFKRVSNSRSILFLHGEIAQLTYQSFVKYIEVIDDNKEPEINITFPIGFRPDNTTIDSTVTYTKENLIERYQYLGLTQLPINGIYQLVTTIETLLGDILKDILIQFPAKISNKKKLDYQLVLGANSLDEIKLSVVESILNELAYKSPKEYGEEFEKYIGIKILEQPIYHRYIELKATRDIYIHNQGVANDTYTIKADRLSRVKSGQFLPVDIQYFLQSYENCIQLTEIIEEELNKIWPSLDYQKSKTQNIEQQKEQAIEKAIETAEALPAGNERQTKLTNKRKKRKE